MCGEGKRKEKEKENLWELWEMSEGHCHGVTMVDKMSEYSTARRDICSI